MHIIRIIIVFNWHLSCRANCIIGLPWIILLNFFQPWVPTKPWLPIRSTNSPPHSRSSAPSGKSIQPLPLCQFLSIIFQPKPFHPHNFWSKKFFSSLSLLTCSRFTNVSVSNSFEFPFSVWIFWPLSLNVRNVLYKTLVLLCIFVACLSPFLLFFFFLLFLHGKNFVKQHDAKVFSKARQMSEVILTPRSTPFYLRFLEALHLQSNQSINVTSATLLLLFFWAFFFFFFFSQLVLSPSYTFLLLLHPPAGSICYSSLFRFLTRSFRLFFTVVSV